MRIAIAAVLALLPAAPTLGQPPFIVATTDGGNTSELGAAGLPSSVYVVHVATPTSTASRRVTVVR